MSSYTLTVTPHVPASERTMVEFDRAIQALHAHTPLQYFRWDQRPATPTVYDYRILAADGRVWIQVYTYDGTAAQPKARTSGDDWYLPEIDLHRDVRRILLLLVAGHGVTNLRATFA